VNALEFQTRRLFPECFEHALEGRKQMRRLRR
jgi:hypothetical protein